MITDALHCRLLALTHGDFNAVANAARKFGKPIGGRFDQSPNILAWDELLSYADSDWSWASGVPVSNIRLRIAVFHMGTLSATVRAAVGVGSSTNLTRPTTVGVFGILSGFSSLSNATRDIVTRAFLTDRVPLGLNLSDLMTSSTSSARSSLVGYTYSADGIFHTLNSVIPQQLESTIADLARRATTIHSVQLQASTSIVEIDQRADLSVSAEAGDPAYAVEDCQQIFRLIQPNFDPITL
jgi:hypothetical protein